MISRDIERTKDDPQLPDRLKFEEIELSEDTTVNLSGRIEVIRTDNNDSFQGPLEREFDIVTSN